jgi:hypothetical protein
MPHMTTRRDFLSLSALTAGGLGLTADAWAQNAGRAAEAIQ